MPRRRDVVGPPAGFVADGGTWPQGPFVEDVPPSVLVAAHISTQLREAIDDSGQSVTQVAAGLGVARTTVYDIVNGTTFPDLRSVSSAESYFGRQLWPAFKAS